MKSRHLRMYRSFTSMSFGSNTLLKGVWAPSQASFVLALLLLASAVGRASTLVHAPAASKHLTAERELSRGSSSTVVVVHVNDSNKAQYGGKHKDFLTTEQVNFLENYFDCRSPEAELEQQEDPEGKLGLVHVAYSANAQQFGGILLSMNSIARHAAHPEHILIHVIVTDEDMEDAKHMIECYKGGEPETKKLPGVLLHSFAGVRFNLNKLKQTWRPELAERQQVFTRFYLHELMPHAPRVIWLDSDTIVKTDIAPLYRMRMEHPVAALLEAGQQHKGRLFPAARQLNRSAESLEFNTGVMVFDLEKWRSENLTRQCERFTMRVNAVGGDQIAMNLALYGRIDAIEDWRWNVRGWNIRRPPWVCLESAKILHWSGNPEFTKKPWLIGTSSSERWRWGYELVEPYMMVDEPCNLEWLGNSTRRSAKQVQLRRSA